MRVLVIASIAGALAPGCATNVCVVHERVRGPDAPLGMDIERRLAADGRPLTIDWHNSLSHARSRYRYDARGRLAELRHVAHNEEYFAPHPSEIDQSAASWKWSVDYRYDDAGRLVQARRRERDQATRTVDYRYDDAHLIGVVHGSELWVLSWNSDCLARAAHFAGDADQPSMVHEHTCDERGHVVEDAFTADFIAHRWRYLFTTDDAGRLTARHLLQERDDVLATPTLAQGFRYDASDRLLAIEAGPASDGIPSIEYRYDSAGRLVSRKRKGDEALFSYGERCSLTAVRSLQPSVPPRLTAPWWFEGEEWRVPPLDRPRR